VAAGSSRVSRSFALRKPLSLSARPRCAAVIEARTRWKGRNGPHWVRKNSQSSRRECFSPRVGVVLRRGEDYLRLGVPGRGRPFPRVRLCLPGNRNIFLETRWGTSFSSLIFERKGLGGDVRCERRSNSPQKKGAVLCSGLSKTSFGECHRVCLSLLRKSLLLPCRKN